MGTDAGGAAAAPPPRPAVIVPAVFLYPDGPPPPDPASAPPPRLFNTPAEGTHAVREGYDYWTGKLTDFSIQMSYAVVGANWALFASVDGIRANRCAVSSVGLAVLNLGLMVAWTWYVGYWHHNQLRFAEEHQPEWKTQFENSLTDAKSRWPFSSTIEEFADWMRVLRFVLPILAALLCFAGLW